MKKTINFILVLLSFIFLSFTPAKADMSEFLSAISGMQVAKDIVNIEPIMLNPEIKQKLKKVYIEAKDTSPTRKASTEAAKTKIADGLKAKGYEIVDNPADAEYIVQINIDKLNVMKEKKSSFFGGLLRSLGSSVLGVAGAFVGASTGNADIAVMAAEVGSSIGSSAGESIGSSLDESVAGYNYSYLGSFRVVVTEKYEGNSKTYNGKYPLIGDSKDITGTITEDISEKISKIVVEIF